MAGLGGNDEARGYRKAYLPHLGKVGAFAAQQRPHIGAAFAEIIDVLR
ncbi:hypothetical protein SDC9_102907 [bioreactor metagenome]|uniref:Uncharacterized protein n=1 Tax=bioreactor metagenome TaxID=1076179 RepID=A0A645ATM2_9ZZZZ